MKVREYREKKELTQSEVARVLEITQSSYNLKENNKRSFNVQELLKLEDLFDTTIKVLFSDKKRG